MVEIAGAQDVIALFIFALHILEEHLKLGISLGGICPVGRQVHIENNQLSAVFNRNPGIIVAAVQVQNFPEACRDRKAPAQRESHIQPALCQKPGIGLSVRAAEGVHQVGRMVILRENTVPLAGFVKHTGDNLRLVHMPLSFPPSMKKVKSAV